MTSPKEQILSKLHLEDERTEQGHNIIWWGERNTERVVRGMLDWLDAREATHPARLGQIGPMSSVQVHGPGPFFTLTPEELAKVMPVSEREIREALELGVREAEAARTGVAHPAPTSSPSEDKPSALTELREMRREAVSQSFKYEPLPKVDANPLSSIQRWLFIAGSYDAYELRACRIADGKYLVRLTDEGAGGSELAWIEGSSLTEAIDATAKWCRENGNFAASPSPTSSPSEDKLADAELNRQALSAFRSECEELARGGTGPFNLYLVRTIASRTAEAQAELTRTSTEIQVKADRIAELLNANQRLEAELTRIKQSLPGREADLARLREENAELSGQVEAAKRQISRVALEALEVAGKLRTAVEDCEHAVNGREAALAEVARLKVENARLGGELTEVADVTLNMVNNVSDEWERMYHEAERTIAELRKDLANERGAVVDEVLAGPPLEPSDWKEPTPEPVVIESEGAT